MRPLQVFEQMIGAERRGLLDDQVAGVARLQNLRDQGVKIHGPLPVVDLLVVAQGGNVLQIDVDDLLGEGLHHLCIPNARSREVTGVQADAHV